MLLQKRKTDLPIWEDVFGSFFNNDLLNFPQNYKEINSSFPAANIKDNDSEFNIELAIPGKKKEDFKIDVNENILTISSQEEKSNEEKGENFTRKEFSYKSFKRSFKLPEVAEFENSTAKYEDGILKIVIPKKKNTKEAIKQITIS